jgi:Putative peptidoglycan binding domain
MAAIDCSVPRHLAVMRAITGLEEYEGSADNPKIMAMRDWIACTYSNVDGMMDYCQGYTGDDVAWCGLASAFCCCVAGIMPPFKKGSDTDCFFWAQSFASDPGFREIDQPVLGAIAVLTRSGGGHVTMFEGWADSGHNSFKGRGGNQSDAVTVGTYPVDDLIGFFWPTSVPLPIPGPDPEPDPGEHRTLEEGDSGKDVAMLQSIVGVPPYDGEFGPATDSGVRAFQGAAGLAKDGQVGPQTWNAIDDFKAKLDAGNDGISAELASAIDRLVADASDVWAIDDWGEKGEDRGTPPPGYYGGLAKTYALALSKLERGDSGAEIMANAAGDPDEDALAYLNAEFQAQGMDNDDGGIDCLRHLFVLLYGLGMQESSGNCFEGRDMSASNIESDTCEAGLFQSSYNLFSCADEMDELLAEYIENPNGFFDTFRRTLEPNASQLDCYGSGNGATYQYLARRAPAFAALSTAIGLRCRKDHWGPIIRREVSIMPEIDDLLIEVERLVDIQPKTPLATGSPPRRR